MFLNVCCFNIFDYYYFTKNGQHFSLKYDLKSACFPFSSAKPLSCVIIQFVPLNHIESVLFTETPVCFSFVTLLAVVNGSLSVLVAPQADTLGAALKQQGQECEGCAIIVQLACQLSVI